MKIGQCLHSPQVTRSLCSKFTKYRTWFFLIWKHYERNFPWSNRVFHQYLPIPLGDHRQNFWSVRQKMHPPAPSKCLYSKYCIVAIGVFVTFSINYHPDWILIDLIRPNLHYPGRFCTFWSNQVNQTMVKVARN